MMEFYYPLRLGIRRHKPPSSPGGEHTEHRKHRAYEAWREGIQLAEYLYEYEPHFEAEVFADLRQVTAGEDGGLWLILGEPGSGKSTLLREWFRRCAAALDAPRLGMIAPVLVSLKYLEKADLDASDRPLADQLWREGLDARALLIDVPAAGLYRETSERLIWPIWLLDGLDEVGPCLLGERLYRMLATLPGTKVVTCRTVVYESLRPEAGRYIDREYDLLSLAPAEQRNFLARALGDAGRARELHEKLSANVALRLLAGSPLLLALIAEISDRIELPATRAAFYREAIPKLWHRRLADRPELLALRSHRNPVLTALARRMEMRQVEAGMSWLDEALAGVAGGNHAALEQALKFSGLLRIDERRERFSFLHLTFQEYYLAEALAGQGLQPVLERYWHDARFEETLALLMSLLVERGREEAVDEGLCWLINWGRETHRRDPRVLWIERQRSPLRVGLHLLVRSGIALNRLPRARELLTGMVLRSAPCKLAVATDPKALPALLTQLVVDPNPEVRRETAKHPATPPEALARLAADPDSEVQFFAVENPAVPPEALARLANDPDPHGWRREQVASKQATPPEALARLAADPNVWVRRRTAANPATPAEALARLAADPDASVRSRAMSNPAIALAFDPQVEVRRDTARNPGPTPEALGRHAADPDVGLRRHAAGNRTTRPEVLARLAADPDGEVRTEAAMNTGMPAEALARLAADSDARVRRQAAGNFRTPVDALAGLAHDPNVGVRQGLAENPMTPPEALARLAGDAEMSVCGYVAMNPSTPPDALAGLMADPRIGILVVKNPSLLLEDLTVLEGMPNI